ncbi:receptor like protein 30-like [Capsella rubella]|uniref:receptor like protein 30-like n=1 Tax=Capsella rubella TaxID=81985 RepID=UPI000CD5A8F8|nr:receptor like protein 30-like [Capsella rubella]
MVIMIPCFSGIVVTLYFFFFDSVVLHTLASPTVHLCRHDQRDALLEFKHEFPKADMKSSSSAYDMSSWNKSSDCCSWGAVKCDAKSGQVISLELFNLALNNSLKPNSGLFKLQYLQRLSILKCNLYGEILSSFGNLSDLMELTLVYNILVGQVPASVGNLTQLRSLTLYGNELSGKFSVFFTNFTKLFELDLNDNYFEPEILPDMSQFHNLKFFYVRGNSFSGSFPTSLFTIPLLEWVNLGENNFTGPIDFGNVSLFSRLQFLYLADNKFDGRIPESISKFLTLKELDLHNNSFSGPFPTTLFTMPSLQWADLARNQFEGTIDFGNILSSSNLGVLDLSDNKFDGQIPESISKFLKLAELDLSNNKLEGKVPGCLLRLESLKLSHNSFSSFGKSSQVMMDQAQMRELRLDSNSFHGPFPRWICMLRSLELLDLSNNSFNGSVPPCVRSFVERLQVLNLRKNNFSGILPDVFANAFHLQALDVSRNRLEGRLPESLINCTFMRLLNVEVNKFNDKFPSWLGSLPRLSVLILRSNQLYGPISSTGFQTLKVIDISHNDFSGTLPTFYFSNWLEMSQMNPLSFDSYMGYYILSSSGFYISSMEMVHKGVDTEFEKIRTDYTSIDFSSNMFDGKIPESIGLLKELRYLNMSNNAFTSNIPQPLANLTILESLDLSQNQLSGQIPGDLGELSFLSTMNFAHNNLEGPIPRGTQFQRQNCSSFMDNPKLSNLEDVCGKPHDSNLTSQESVEPEEPVINWIAVAIAYGPGVFCGLVMGHIFVSHKHEWLMEKFGRKKSRVFIRSAR